MNIVNPLFKLDDENIFTMRERDYSKLLEVVSQIIKPVEEIGFTISDFGLKEPRFSSGELSRTLRQTLVMQFKKGNSTIDLNVLIPKLVDGNYLIINGRKKIPLFQLFDIPVVTRGETVKIRTNVATIMIFRDREAPKVKISLLGKKVPLATLLFAYFGTQEVITKFSLHKRDKERYTGTEMYPLLIEDLFDLLEESKGWTQDDFIVELGRYYTKYTAKSKGEDILYALDVIPKIDILTAQFLTQPLLIDEIVESLKIGYLDDTLFLNKRVRCFEYLVYAKIAKNIFDFCFSNRSVRQPNFSVNSNQIISDSNVSDIVQFDFSINPIEELTKLSRISLLGPGGFKRENIPRHLRDICPTMFGRICPVDTPDRDNCGVLQNLLPNVHLDNQMKFTNQSNDDAPISIPVSMVPFCEHDDQTRLQMASSQMRQSIMLRDFDAPMIASGCEGLYTDKTQFVKVAKKSGEVIHVDNKFIIVHYDDGDMDLFNIEYRKIYVEHLDFMKIYVEEGDKVKAGDILAESNFSKDGKICFGKNLLTGVMVYYGNNYEDGIVISDRLVEEDLATSVHYRDLSFTIPPDKVLLTIDKQKYKPLPELLETIEIGQPYAKIKKLTLDDFYSVFNEAKELTAEKRFIISDVNIYPNEWNTEIPEYREWIEKTIALQQDRENYVKEIIRKKSTKAKAEKFIRENNLDLFSHIGKYREKKEKINGVKVELYGIHFRRIRVGDKVGNRHGNKGVISRIVEHEKMPQLEDGRHLDICINPLGIISRMNIGQLYELHLSEALYGLKQESLKMLSDGDDQEEIKSFILGFIKRIDKTKDNWYSQQFEEQMPEEITEEFIEEMQAIQPPFESIKLKDLERVMKYVGKSFKQKILDPLSKEELLNPIAVGYQYFFRMVHIAEEKLAARGIGTYAKRTLQPLGGRKNKGGQRCGEMETACIIGHDATLNLFEFLTTKSDCIDLKNKYIREVIEFNPMSDEIELDTTPESVKLLNAYLTVLGVDHSGNSGD